MLTEHLGDAIRATGRRRLVLPTAGTSLGPRQWHTRNRISGKNVGAHTQPICTALIDLRHNLLRHEFEMIEIGEVEDLEVDTARADVPEATDRLDDLLGCAGGAVRT